MQSRRQTYSRLHHHSRSSTSLKDPYLDRLTRFWTLHDRTRVTHWAQNAPMLLIGDAARAQSLDIMEGFGHHQIDFRRFQFELEKDIPSDAYGDDATYDLMKRLGEELGERIRKDQFAPNADPRYDPEGLNAGQAKYQAAKAAAQARSSK